MILHMAVIKIVGGGWVQCSDIKWSTKTTESQRSKLGSWWTLLVLTAFQIENKRHWPALCDLHTQPSTHQYKRAWPANGAKAQLVHSRLRLDLIKAATETRLIILEHARYSEEYDSVLSQQSISGKTVNLILLGWKQGFSNLATCDPLSQNPPFSQIICFL